MKKAIIVFLIGSILVVIFNLSQINPNQHSVNGKNGTYTRTNPNSTKSDNINTNKSDILTGIIFVGIGTLILFFGIIPWVEEKIQDKNKSTPEIKSLPIAHKVNVTPKSKIEIEENKPPTNIQEFLTQNKSKRINARITNVEYNNLKTAIIISCQLISKTKIDFQFNVEISPTTLSNDNSLINCLLYALNCPKLISQSRSELLDAILNKRNQSIGIEIQSTIKYTPLNTINIKSINKPFIA